MAGRRRRRNILMLAVGLCPTAASLSGCAPQGALVPAGAVAAAPPAEARELVVLVHGLGRTRLSMLPLAWTLEREGFEVMNWGYSSTRYTIPELGARLGRELRTRGGPPPERVHFVGHSLGNVVIRWVLAHDAPRNAGRVVMLAPPNQGSRVADRYTPWLGWLLRPLAELRTDSTSTARTLPMRAGVEFLVLAGRYDGKVTVAETRLAGAAANVTVPAAHTFIMADREVRRRTVAFLRGGE